MVRFGSRGTNETLDILLCSLPRSARNGVGSLLLLSLILLPRKQTMVNYGL